MPRKIASEQFASIRMWRWSELQIIIDLLKSKSRKNLSNEQVMKFPELYRSACADLAQARMKNLAPDLIEYLNTLVGQANQLIYSRPPIRKRHISHFFKIYLPETMFRAWPFVLLSAFIFIASAVISGVYINNDPQSAGRLVPESVLELMEQSYSETIDEGRSLGMSGFMTSYYIQHNSTIAFYSFAAGVLGGIGALYFLIYNGIFLGAIAGYIISLGYSKNFFTFVLAHSVPELTGLVLAAAAGFYLGYNLIKSTRKKRLEDLKSHLNNILSLVVTAAILLFIAAVIEGTISGSAVGLVFRIITAVIMLGSLGFYFLAVPLMRHARERRIMNE